MTRLVFVTQQVDPAHPVLGAAVPQIAALAARVDEIAVLTDTAVPGSLPENCRVRTFAARRRVGRGVRFERALVGELRPRHEAAVVAHMCPVYAILAAPLVRPLGLPLVLWYAHWRPTPALRVAERLATAVVSTHRLSLPIESGKLLPIGQAIDVASFPCLDGRGARGRQLRLLALGRYSVVKGYETILRALAAARAEGVDAELAVHGPCATPAEEAHLADLEALRLDLGLGAAARLEGGVPRAQVPALLAGADAVVNATRGGSSDKALFEACASCVPVLASNPVVAELLPPELRFAEGDVADLAARIAALARASTEERQALGRELRVGVERGHSVDTWADGVLRAAGLSAA